MTPKLAPQIVSSCDRAVKVMWLRIELKFAEEHLKQRQKWQTLSQSLAPSFPGPSPFGFGVGEWLCLLREGLVYFLVSVKYWGEKYFNIMPKYTGSNFFCGNCQQIAGKSTFYKHKKRFYNFSSWTWKMAATTHSKMRTELENIKVPSCFKKVGRVMMTL